MSKELVSSIDIAAPAERVWEVLVDFAAFPAWNPFITQAEGRLEVGGRLTLRMQPVGGSAVILQQQEQFTGLLLPFFQRSLDRGTLPAFEAMNAALKARAEGATAARG
jgi:hypothetical protein